MTDMHYLGQPVLEMVSCELFAQGGLEPVIFPISIFQVVAMITVLSHHTWAQYSFVKYYFSQLCEYYSLP
jgi:hypothetical protein